MKNKFKRDINSLESIFKFLDEFVAHHSLEEAISFAMHLAVEELFTNMVKHQIENSSEILIDVFKDASQVVITLTDYNASPYDINNVDEYDPNRSLEDREPGGVGIHLVKQFFDKVDYNYKNGTSTITLYKYLEKSHA